MTAQTSHDQTTSDPSAREPAIEVEGLVRELGKGLRAFDGIDPMMDETVQRTSFSGHVRGSCFAAVEVEISTRSPSRTSTRAIGGLGRRKSGCECADDELRVEERAERA